MDVHKRLTQLMEERGWTKYQLAIASNLSQSSVSNLFVRNYTPSLPTLQAICDGLGITMSQFFAEGNLVELSDEQKQFFDQWVYLTKRQKQVVQDLIAAFHNE